MTKNNKEWHEYTPFGYIDSKMVKADFEKNISTPANTIVNTKPEVTQKVHDKDFKAFKNALKKMNIKQ